MSRRIITALLIISAFCLLISAGRAPQAAQQGSSFSDASRVVDILMTKYVGEASSNALLKSFTDAIAAELDARKIPSKQLRYALFTSNSQEDLKTVEKLVDTALATHSTVTKDELVSKGLVAMAASLKDNNTKFYPPGAYHVKLMEASFKGGIGLLVDEEKTRDGSFLIVETIEGMPSQKAGIRAGDMLVKVAGKEVKSLELHQVAELVIGEIGTPLTLTVETKDRKERRDITLERVPLPPNPKNIYYSTMKDSIGYLKFKYLGYRLEPETQAALTALKNQKVKALIIDLRDNGGYPQAAISLSGLFLAKETPIVTEVLKSTQKLYVAKYDSYFNLPLCILVNEYSSSASTIMAEALRHAKRGKVIGAQTKWRYACTERFDLSGGGVLTVTTHYYELPDGRTLKKSGEGVKPDVAVPQNPFEDTASDRDVQLQKALELLSK